MAKNITNALALRSHLHVDGTTRLAGETTMTGDITVGESSTKRVGFFGATPVDQPSAYTQTYSTADKTVANATAAALTDNSGGTASQTLADITEAQNSGSADRVPTENAIASLADEVNKLIADVDDIRQTVTAVIDDLQELGLLA